MVASGEVEISGALNLRHSFPGVRRSRDTEWSEAYFAGRLRVLRIATSPEATTLTAKKQFKLLKTRFNGYFDIFSDVKLSRKPWDTI